MVDLFCEVAATNWLAKRLSKNKREVLCMVTHSKMSQKRKFKGVW